MEISASRNGQLLVKGGNGGLNPTTGNPIGSGGGILLASDTRRAGWFYQQPDD